MNVLSLFDGMSCGQLALKKAGINYDNYFASEIDPYAIKVTQTNFPNTIQLGDITKIVAEDLPKIDLLIGGSPCQGFSLAGKQLNFNDARSKLFFEFIRLKNELSPKYFLLENVKMKKEYSNIISEYLGVQPVEINSSLVSAQTRRRLYWTNIPFTNIKDKNINLKDILMSDDDPKLTFEIPTEARINYIKRRSTKGWVKKDIFNTIDTPKVPCITAVVYKTMKEYLFKYEDNRIRFLSCTELERLQNVPDDYTRAVSKSQRRKMLGNGWTVDVVAHILSGIKESNDERTN